MKLRIRYENEIQTIELNEKDTETLWVSLSLEGEGISKKEKEELIQEAWEEEYNRPSYGRVVESHPRQCIIIATVNGERGYLRDITGNRQCL